MFFLCSSHPWMIQQLTLYVCQWTMWVTLRPAGQHANSARQGLVMCHHNADIVFCFFLVCLFVCFYFFEGRTFVVESCKPSTTIHQSNITIWSLTGQVNNNDSPLWWYISTQVSILSSKFLYQKQEKYKKYILLSGSSKNSLKSLQLIQNAVSRVLTGMRKTRFYHIDFFVIGFMSHPALKI